MQIIGKELLTSNPNWLKFIFNRQRVRFSVPSSQHRDISDPVLKYDDAVGNAQAGQIINGHVEIRGHERLNFSSAEVKILWQKILRGSESNYLRTLEARYKQEVIYTPPPKEKSIT